MVCWGSGNVENSACIFISEGLPIKMSEASTDLETVNLLALLDMRPDSLATSVNHR